MLSITASIISIFFVWRVFVGIVIAILHLNETTLSTVASITSIISGLGGLVGVVVAVLQLRKTAKVAEADHSRRKKEATMTYYYEIRSDTERLIGAINSVLGDKPVTVSQCENCKGLTNKISRYLNLMERLAVGIHFGVFDYDVYRALLKTDTVKRFCQFRAYICYTRENKSAPKPNTFIHFERLALRLKNDKTDSPDTGVKKP